MAFNSQTFEPFGLPQRDPEQQIFGQFSSLNLGGGSTEDIELDDVQPVQKRLTAKQLRRIREAEAAAKKSEGKKRKAAQQPSNVNKQKRAKLRFERRKSQKDRLDAINRDPQLVERRLQALKQLHASAQDLHNATENKIELKQALRNLTENLASHTEKSADELYADLCQSDNIRSAEAFIEGEIKDPLHPEASLKEFIQVVERPVQSPYALPFKTPTRERITKRRNTAPINIVQPKFKLLAPSREQKIRNSQNWKRAQPLVIDLSDAVAAKPDIAIARSYAAARIPIKKLAEGLERGYEEILSEVIPSFTRERIAHFEAPFVALEEAGKPVLPDLSTLTFNDGPEQPIAA